MNEPEMTLRLRRTLITYNKMETSRKQFERIERGLTVMVESLNSKERTIYDALTGTRVVKTRGPKERKTNGTRENHPAY